MAIKSKGITALPAVKIISFVLIILLAFAFMSDAYFMARQFMNSNVDLEIVFANVSGNDLFYRSYMQKMQHELQNLLFYESEDNIRKGNCIKWVESEDGENWLVSTDGTRNWGTAPNSLHGYYLLDYTEKEIREQRDNMEREAINSQLQYFRALQNEIKSQTGLLYYVANKNIGLANTDNYDMEFFMSQPVYLIIENGMSIAQSHSLDFSSSGGAGTMYIAFTEEAINIQNNHWLSMQRIVIAQVAAMIVIVILAFVLFFTLLCGAGRKRYDNTVYFNILDKPYLDIGLAALTFYEVAVGAAISSAIGNLGGDYIRVVDERNTRNILVLLAFAAALMLPPILFYTMSFAKRVKAGKWWRHTLIWSTWHAIWSRCVSFAKSLWAGAPLTLRVCAICFCLFCAMLIVSLTSYTGTFGAFVVFVLTVLPAIPMLWYARRLKILEAGAKSASKGDYGTIDAGGGELGRIAGYINNISAGIEAAVDERLKSERLKTELITNVSHDIRTPLTSIITYTDLLKNEGLDCEKAPEYLDILIQKSQRLKTLTDELFEAAKAATGNIEANIETLDIADLMRQVLGELDERILGSGLDFRLNLPEHAWALADGKLLWRVAENLLSNVFKYALPNSRVYIDITSEGGDVRLDIKNISAQPLNVEPPELMERFKRGDESRSSEGSGLGLSIVQSFIEAQNGRFKLAIDGDLFKASVYMPEVNK